MIMINMPSILRPWTAIATTLLLSRAVMAQWILHNAKVYTVDPANPTVDAIAMDTSGILVGVGTYDELVAEFPSYPQQDMQGQSILPGFHDVHLHAVEAGINGQLCDLPSDTVVADISSWLDESCAFGGQEWIMGAGIDLANVMEQIEQDVGFGGGIDGYPIAVLDEQFPDTPVVILDALGHGALANTAALQAVGYDLTMTDPKGGGILVDANGNLLGIVVENAQQLLRNAAFPPTVEDQAVAKQSLIEALGFLNQNGITSVSDAGGFWKQAQTQAWEQVLADGMLTVRASNALYIYPDQDISNQLPQLLEQYSNDPSSLLRFNQAKIYVDGILSLATGKVYEPYLYDPFEFYRQTDYQSTGMTYFGDTLNAVAATLVDNGFQLHFHVTGDKAAGLALDAIAATDQAATGWPHRLTHCYLVSAMDRPRFADQGVIADFQLAPSSVDPDYTAVMAQLLGVERAATLLPALELYRQNATITLSSDWDADVLSPLAKIQTVLTRPDGRSFDSVETVIPMLTIHGAKALQQDDTTGSIQVGKFADLVVLDKDIFSIPVDQISTAKVMQTYLQGDIVYDSSRNDDTTSSQGASASPAATSSPAAAPVLGRFPLLQAAAALVAFLLV